MYECVGAFKHPLDVAVATAAQAQINQMQREVRKEVDLLSPGLRPGPQSKRIFVSHSDSANRIPIPRQMPGGVTSKKRTLIKPHLHKNAASYAAST